MALFDKVRKLKENILVGESHETEATEPFALTNACVTEQSYVQ